MNDRSASCFRHCLYTLTEFEVMTSVRDMTASGWLSVSMSTSYAVGRRFAPNQGPTKDHHKNGTNCLPALHACVRGRSLTVQSDCLKGLVVCETVWVHSDLERIARVRYYLMAWISICLSTFDNEKSQ